MYNIQGIITCSAKPTNTPRCNFGNTFAQLHHVCVYFMLSALDNHITMWRHSLRSFVQAQCSESNHNTSFKMRCQGLFKSPDCSHTAQMWHYGYLYVYMVYVHSAADGSRCDHHTRMTPKWHNRSELACDAIQGLKHGHVHPDTRGDGPPHRVGP